MNVEYFAFELRVCVCVCVCVFEHNVSALLYYAYT